MDDRIEELPASTCLQLLGSGHVGRVAVNGDPSPVVLPVNYVYRDEGIVFTTAAGTKWDAAREGAPASFQVDAANEEHRSGWSVLVRGRLSEVEDPSPEVQQAIDRLHPLVGGNRPHVVALSMDEATGRRILQDPAWVRAHLDGNTWTDRDGSDLLG
jgi:nitroimidazol reductase NimA-like FMN-containing flavoprotein (pyridoxamine 5'-phosphate oxidase superfamily)